MSIVVQKFGGKLLETPEKIIQAAKYIIKTKLRGESPIVIVSAPGKTTAKFIELANKVSANPDEREMDMLLSVGERTAMALLAIAIMDLSEYSAISFTGSQVGIITDTQHLDANVLEVRGYRIKDALDKGKIPIIAGFQGVSIDKEITTLGKGGSDLTAVSLAIVFNAERCELVKEHGGVFSADPEIIPDAVLHSKVDYDTMESLSTSGAIVVQGRAISLAKDHAIKLNITGIDGDRGTDISDVNLNLHSVAAIQVENGLSLKSDFDFSKNLIEGSRWQAFTWNSKDGILAFDKRTQKSAESISIVSILGWGMGISNDVLSTVFQFISKSKNVPLACFGTRSGIKFFLPAEKANKFARDIHNLCIKSSFIN